jgi:hypothetical protein
VTVNLRHLRIAVVLALLASLAACAPQLTPDQFVGTWKSSRSTEPLTLHANGDWEIRDGDDRTLQYGVWQLRGRTFIWIDNYSMTRTPSSRCSREASSGAKATER